MKNVYNMEEDIFITYSTLWVKRYDIDYIDVQASVEEEIFVVTWK